jgi:PIN domain nuclease of toxin-antitoxin system
MSSFVLDASAVLTLLNDEPGADEVEARLEDSMISAVNLSEVLTKLIEAGIPSKEAFETVDLLGIEVVDFNAEQALAAASLRPATRKSGLSLGDRCCLALGLQTKRQVVTADKSWTALKVCKVVQIR